MDCKLYMLRQLTLIAFLVIISQPLRADYKTYEEAVKSALRYEEAGNNQKALECYTKAIDIDPANVELLMRRGNLLLLMNNQARALVDYNAVLDVQPSHTKALLYRANIYRGMRNYRAARADYQTLIERNPHERMALLGLILTNDADGRPLEAMEQMNTLVAVWPEDALLYLMRGEMFMKRDLPNQAIEDFDQSIQLDTTNADAYLSRAHYYKKVKKRELMRQDALRALRLGADANTVYTLIKTK